MCQLSVVNKAGDIVAERVTPEKFMSFKKEQGKGFAVAVELSCGQDLFVDSVELLSLSATRCSLQGSIAAASGQAAREP